MSNCGADNRHGGGCGFHSGTSSADGVLVGKRPGNWVSPTGMPIPLLNGAKDCPIGVTGDDSGTRLGAAGDEEKIELPGNSVFALALGKECGWSNCRNCSTAACCSDEALGGGAGVLKDFDQPLSGAWAGAMRLSGILFKS